MEQDMEITLRFDLATSNIDLNDIQAPLMLKILITLLCDRMI